MKKLLLSVLALGMMASAFATTPVREKKELKSFAAVTRTYKLDQPLTIAMLPGVNNAPQDALTFTNIEIAWYPSYDDATKGHNYSVNLLNVENKTVVPHMVQFDIYTQELGQFAGTYKDPGDYSYYIFGTGETDYAKITKLLLQIKESGENLVLNGSFTADAAHTFSVTAKPFVYNAEYYMEPEDARDITMPVNKMEEPEIYNNTANGYSLAYITFDTPTDTLQLMYFTTDTELAEIPDGTFEVAEAGSADKTIAAGYYSEKYSSPMYSFLYSASEAGIFYIVEGSLKVETTSEGRSFKADVKSFYESSIKAEFLIKAEPQAIENTAVETKATKIIRNGQLYIIRDGKMYNAIGAEVR